jgi:hypothetical protein
MASRSSMWPDQTTSPTALDSTLNLEKKEQKQKQKQNKSRKQKTKQKTTYEITKERGSSNPIIPSLQARFGIWLPNLLCARFLV